MELSSLNIAIAEIVDLEIKNPIRDSILRISTVLVIVGFYILATSWILFDRLNTDSDDSTTTLVPDSNQFQLGSTLRHLLIAIIVVFSILGFSTFHDYGGSGLLVIIGFALSALPLTRLPRWELQLTTPVPLKSWETLGLVGISIASLILSLHHWNTYPAGMNSDHILIGLNAIAVWTDNRNPFSMSGANIPSLFDVIDGLFILLTQNPRLGLMLHPAICGALSSVIMYRWICLFGTKPLAWFSTILFIFTPYFQFYSRTPLGTTLVFCELVFLYGLTRAFFLRGIRASLLAGLALGLSQWIYWAARGLIIFYVWISGSAFFWRKRFYKGFAYRLSLIALIAFPITISFLAINDPMARSWDYLLLPKAFSINENAFRLDLNFLCSRLREHWNMWFRSDGNAATYLTIPGTSVLPYPMIALFLLGLGSWLTYIIRIPALIVMSLFFVALPFSMFGTGQPSGHRIMIAEVPVAIFMGHILSAFWPTKNVNKKLRFGLVTVTVCICLISAYSGLKYFCNDVYRDERTLSAQDFPTFARANRIEKRLREENTKVRVFESFTTADQFLLYPKLLEVVNWGKWLPFAWESESLVVEAVNSPFARFLNDLFPRSNWDELYSPTGKSIGWGYKTDGERLALGHAQSLWRLGAEVGGTFLLPSEGKLEVECPKCKIHFTNSEQDSYFENRAVISVLRGLSFISFRSIGIEGYYPDNVPARFIPNTGKNIWFDLTPTSLSLIPLNGWYVNASKFKSGEISKTDELSRSATPALYTIADNDNLFLNDQEEKKTIYSARFELPPGEHRFKLNRFGPKNSTCVIINGEVFSKKDSLGQIEFNLAYDPKTDNSIQIFNTVPNNYHALTLFVVDPNGIESVPPYKWFYPLRPSSKVETLCSQ